ncbi:hypothetical protein OIO90_001518 [Microbotryomycetes sp. JL221]|nr:hypothetical protein OIO90_001518 [Microbotryomycetes sp. JL221]
MQGLSINDASGRRVLSTHFVNQLDANLAIEAALATSDSIIWVPSLQFSTTSSHAHEAQGSDDDSDVDACRNELDDVWRQDGQARHDAAHANHGNRRTGGQAVCQIERNGLRYIAPIASSVDPIIPLTFLDRFHSVLETYDNFDIVLALMEEMMASGRPLVSESSQLKELVVPPSQLLAKVANTAATVAGLANAMPIQSPANALLASPLPWRRQGLRYSSNEIYFDMIETLEFVLDKTGKILTGNITGEVECRSKLSGMPDLNLSFTDPTQLDDCAFHPSVRFGKWNKDKLISFVPPDGSFNLMQYQVGGLVKTSSASPMASLSTASANAILPLSIQSTVTHGSQGGSFSITMNSKTSYSRPLTNIQLRLDLGRGANGVQATVSGGGYLKDAGGKVTGSGAGEWQIVSEDIVGSGGKGGMTTTSQVLIWTIDELISTDRPAVLEGQYFCPPETKPSPAFTVSFDSPMAGFSGVRIASLKMSGESYSVFKGVKSRGRGTVEVRSFERKSRDADDRLMRNSVLHLLDKTLLQPTTALGLLWYSFHRAKQIYGPVHTLRDHLNSHKWLKRLVMISLLTRINRLLNRVSMNGGLTRDKPTWSKGAKLNDKVLITGGAAGIGHEVAKLLSKHTTNIAVLDMSEPRQPVKGVKYFKCDVTDSTAVADVAKQVRQQIGDPTIIINNAGILRGGSLLENTTESMMLTFKVNVCGVQTILKEFLPHLIAIQRGHHVLIASCAAYVSVANLGEYSASKSAVLSVHETLREELKYRYNAPGVRTSVVTPTKVATPLGQALNDLDGQFLSPTIRPEWLAARIVDIINSGVSSHLLAPSMAGVLLPSLRCVPDWVGWILSKVGKYDKVVTADSLVRHKTVYTTVKDLEKSSAVHK